MRTLQTFLLLLLAAFTTAISYAQDSKAIARKALASTVFIVTKDADDQPLAQGSGFFVRPGLIATNWHVVSDAAKVTFSLMGQDQVYGAVIQKKDVEHDIALLKIVDDVSVPSLSLGDSAGVEIGERIYTVGNPKGLEGTFSEGVVSGFRTYEGVRRIQFTAPIAQGSSGGPVLNARGEVIAIVKSTLVDGQNINFAVPSGYIKLLCYDPELQNVYERAIALDLIYEDRHNHKLIDSLRKAISDGIIKEVPDGITSWYSPYDPFDPKTQAGYVKFYLHGKGKNDSELSSMVRELIRRHIIHEIKSKSK